jgi:hypothetical protein
MRPDPSFRRSAHAQIAAMQKCWPRFVGHKFGDGTLAWVGILQPQAQPYAIEVYWNPKVFDRPYVIVADPVISPRAGLDFAEIPHLMFNAKEPTRSGLCLFDPAGREWTPADLIAVTTIDWAAEWLTYYELWHLTGEWLAPGVGHESVGQLRAGEARALRGMIAKNLKSQDKGEAAWARPASPKFPGAFLQRPGRCCGRVRRVDANTATSC